MRIAVKAKTSGKPIGDVAADTRRAVDRSLKRELRKLATKAVQVWRKATPRRRGTLRASEVAIFRANGNRYNIAFAVRGAGAAYYRAVAKLDRYAHLRHAQVVNKWTKEKESEYINRAINRALR